jgi:hypothetical protein
MAFYISKILPGTFNPELITMVAANLNKPTDVFMITPNVHLDGQDIIDRDFDTDTLVIGFNDSLVYKDNQYDWWNDKSLEPNEFSFLRKFHQRHPGITIIALVPGSYWPSDYFDPLPITLIDWAAIHENNTYPNLVPVEKDFTSQHIGISLNRQMRHHRLALISLLYGLGLDVNCHMTAMHLYKQLNKLNSTAFLDHNSWQFDAEHEQVKNTFSQGWLHICDLYNQGINFQRPQGTEEAYPMNPDDSVILFDNFNNFERLRPLYRKSFVEIISCNRYDEPEVNIDEKMINSIYARNFPIVVGSAGTVAWYRSFGIDMFDDVVNHSYDNIKNPIDRLWAAIETNKHLIENPETTKKIWQRLENRFNQRIEHSRCKLYDTIKNMTLQKCNEHISKLLINPFRLN